MPESVNVPAFALVRPPSPERAPESVSVRPAPTSKGLATPFESTQALATLRLAKAVTVQLEAIATLAVPKAALLLMATVPALIRVPPL